MRRPLLSRAAVALVVSACAALPPIDDVPAFLDLLDRWVRMDG
jgi:hypothetical protein